jgi:hypothetical protein
MADVAIETSASTNLMYEATRGGIFWQSATVGYVIYIDSSGDLKYRKTSERVLYIAMIVGQTGRRLEMREQRFI